MNSIMQCIQNGGQQFNQNWTDFFLNAGVAKGLFDHSIHDIFVFTPNFFPFYAKKYLFQSWVKNVRNISIIDDRQVSCSCIFQSIGVLA